MKPSLRILTLRGEDWLIRRLHIAADHHRFSIPHFGKSSPPILPNFAVQKVIESLMSDSLKGCPSLPPLGVFASTGRPTHRHFQGSKYVSLAPLQTIVSLAPPNTIVSQYRRQLNSSLDL